MELRQTDRWTDKCKSIIQHVLCRLHQLKIFNTYGLFQVWCFVYLAVVFLSVFVMMVWTEEWARVDRYMESSAITYSTLTDAQKSALRQQYSETQFILGATDPHPAILAVDVICMTVFIVELLVHFVTCPNKVEYFKSVFNLAKIILCTAMIVGFALEFRKSLIKENSDLGQLYIFIKSITAFRLIFIFRLRKIYKGFDLLLLAMSNSVYELLLLVFTFMILVIVYGSLIFSAEYTTDTFKNTGYSMWWAVITMTTVGYGDYYPTTNVGYVVGVAAAINGIIVIALPIAAIASNFDLYYSRAADIEKHVKSIQEQQCAETKENQELDEKKTEALETNITNMTK